ncbi:MAG: phosphonate C-P lyase system protein PhnG [Hyphomicrobiales bacterium]|nr:MAG: phosphonate C-P lyase system protein PhnG [Hyphomicrobiales bacterium]
MTQKILNADIQYRQQWMAVLAKALWSNLEEMWKDIPFSSTYTLLRKPEMGLVMVEGRTGGSGAPFNLGETTVTRCSVGLQSGEVGHAYIMGRNYQHAEIAAICDALMQSERHDEIARNVIDPLKRLASAATAKQSAKAATTKVDFFTVVRGEDE